MSLAASSGCGATRIQDHADVKDTVAFVYLRNDSPLVGGLDRVHNRDWLKTEFK